MKQYDVVIVGGGIHGGLRYLESGQFALVRESLRERAIHLRIAAELVILRRPP
jgi:glycerol-3-phosphate dehydrogenase